MLFKNSVTTFIYIYGTLQLVLVQCAEIPPLSILKTDHDSLTGKKTYHVSARIDGQVKKLELNPLKQDVSVLDKNMKFIQNGLDQNGELVSHIWTPSLDERRAAESDLHFDFESKAILRIKEGHHHDVMEGIIGDHTVRHDGHQQIFTKISSPNSDYVKYNLDGYYNNSKKLEKTNMAVNAETENIVELLIVCDKEFGDVFGHDRQKILDYWTVYMWDVNLRYKSLPSVNLQFRVIGLVVAATIEAQPYIEESRGPDGRVEHGRILNNFGNWINVQSAQGKVPIFDMAISVSNAEQEWGGGLAWMHGTCRVDNLRGYNLNTLSFNDGGNWGSLTVGAHEMGHNVGAPHDDDPNFPGGCAERGYIMGGGNDDLRWFFSSCSDREISSFINSAGADCVRRLDSTPILDPSLDNPKAPSKLEQCVRHTGDPEAWMEPGDESNCKSIRCVYGYHDGAWWIRFVPPVDNTPCGDNKRCFRGQCRSQGYLIRNIGSGLCLSQTNEFSYSSTFQIVPCPSVGTALDRFVMANGATGVTLAQPFVQGSQNAGDHEVGDKCAYTGQSDAEELGVATDRCGEYTNPWHGFDILDVGNSEFVIKHKVTGRCLKPSGRNEGSGLLAYKTCNNNNADFRWTRTL